MVREGTDSANLWIAGGHRSARLPRVRIGDEAADPSREPARRHISHGHGLEDEAEPRPNRHPCRHEVLGRSLVHGLLRTHASHLRQRTFERPEDVGERDFVCGSSQAVTADVPSLAGYEAGPSQVAEDVLDEFGG